MTASGDEKLLAIVDRIYQSVERPELWPQTIQSIGDMIGGLLGSSAGDAGRNSQAVTAPRSIHPHGSIHPYDDPSRASSCGQFLLSRSDLAQLAEYEQEFGDVIARFLKILFLSMLSSPNDVGPREGIGLMIARRLLKGFEQAERGPAASTASAARYNAIAGLWEDGRIFGSDTLRAMRLLIPHLDRALRLQMRATTAGLRADLLSGALDALTLGVVLLNAAAQPLWINRRAQEMLQQSGALRVGPVGLVAASPAQSRSLREMIAGAVSTGAQGLLAIDRGLEQRPLLLIAMPLKPEPAGGAVAEAACAALFISDPDRTDNPSVEALRRAFNLTYREAQTAIAVADGHGLKAAARQMGVAVTTARSQLQQAFAKTGTQHQAELTALIHRTLAPLRHDLAAPNQARIAEPPRAGAGGNGAPAAISLESK